MIQFFNQIFQQLSGSGAQLTTPDGGQLPANQVLGEQSSFAQSFFSLMGKQPAAEGLDVTAFQFSQSGTQTEENSTENANALSLFMPSTQAEARHPHLRLHTSVLDAREALVEDDVLMTGDTENLQVMALFRQNESNPSQSQMVLKVIDTSAWEQSKAAELPKGVQLPEGTAIESTQIQVEGDAQIMEEFFNIEELASTESGRHILQQFVEADELPDGIDLNAVKKMLEDSGETPADEPALRLVKSADLSKVQTDQQKSAAAMKLVSTTTTTSTTTSSPSSEIVENGVQPKVANEELKSRATIQNLQQAATTGTAQTEAIKQQAIKTEAPKTDQATLTNQATTSELKVETARAEMSNQQQSFGEQQGATQNSEIAAKEGSINNIDAELDVAHFDKTLKEIAGLEEGNLIPKDSIERRDFPARLSRIIAQKPAFMSRTLNAETFQQHTFYFDDGESLKVAAKQTEGTLTLQIGAASQDIMRVIQQYSDEIRTHLKNELNIEIDLQFQNGSEQAETAFSQDQKTGETAHSISQVRDAVMNNNLVESTSNTAARLLGFNKNEWVG